MLKSLTNAYCFAAEVWRAQTECCRKRQHSPLYESNAHHCDMCATRRMSRAHGTYVQQSMVDAANSAYVENNKNKNGNALESSDPNQGR